MKQSRFNPAVALASILAFGFGALGKSDAARALQMPIIYPSARQLRSKEEAARRIAAAQAKRDRRCKRNLKLLAKQQGPVCTERVLTPEAEKFAADFYLEYRDGNCSCHISPPCGSCTHPGNPRNLAENEHAWMDVPA